MKNNSNLREITFQIFKKLVDMILGLKISFDQFSSYLHVNEQRNFIVLQCTIRKPTLLLKCKPNNI
jgi:hypothetical protein